MQITPEAQARREAARTELGRFGHQQHSAPEVDARALQREQRRERRQRRLDERLTRISEGGAANAASEAWEQRHREESAVVSTANRLAARHWGRKQLNADQVAEIAQESLTTFYEQQADAAAKRGQLLDLRGADGVESVQRDGALLARVTGSVAQWVSRGAPEQVRHEDLKAYAYLQQREQTFHETHGRAMTPKEREEAAEQVRLSFRPGNRPVIGYHLRFLGATSLNVPIGSEDGRSITLGDSLTAARSRSGTEGEIGGELGEQVDEFEMAQSDWQHTPVKERGAKPKAQDFGLAREQAWEHLAQVCPVPVPRAGILTSKHAATARKHVRTFPGGAAGVAKAIRSGNASQEVTDAFFAPFGDEPGRDQVVELLASHPELADRLWQAAVRAAGKRG